MRLVVSFVSVICGDTVSFFLSDIGDARRTPAPAPLPTRIAYRVHAGVVVGPLLGPEVGERARGGAVRAEVGLELGQLPREVDGRGVQEGGEAGALLHPPVERGEGVVADGGAEDGERGEPDDPAHVEEAALRVVDDQQHEELQPWDEVRAEVVDQQLHEGDVVVADAAGRACGGARGGAGPTSVADLQGCA